MRKEHLILLSGMLTILFAGPSFSQPLRGVCGTSLEDQLLFEPRLLDNLARSQDPSAVQERGSVQYVPVHFHLVGNSGGKGRVAEARVLDQLCALNDAFAPMNIRFYLRPHPTHGSIFNYNINNDNVYDNQTAWFTMQSQRHPNAINIYIVNQATTSNNQPGVTLAYYNPQRDWIVCRKDQINGSKSNSTLPHEVGHFFSLQHTFFGWESQPFTPSSPSWPKAPATSPGGSPTERMNGTNCTTAADKICDTPPDYNFGFGATSCAYTGGAQDPLGVPVAPMVNNMMGYFNFCSEYVFTPQQRNAILADRASSARNYLNNNFSPIATEIITPPDLLIAPVGGVEVPFYDDVQVEWHPVNGAKYYLVEFDIVNSFSSSFAQYFVTSGTKLTVTTLLPNRLYQWRVRPFNEYVTCATARQSSFRTPTTSADREIAQLRRWHLTPNPFSPTAGAPQMTLETHEAIEVEVHILDATGRVLYVQGGIYLSAGKHTFSLPAEVFSSTGIYWVVLQSLNGRSIKRLAAVR